MKRFDRLSTHFFSAARTYALLGTLASASACSYLPSSSGLQTAMFATSGSAPVSYAAVEADSVTIPVSQLMTNASVTVTRGLPNETFLPGDNSVTYMRLSSWGFGSPVARALGRIGTLPAPFEYITERDFRPAGDFHGQYHYAVSSPDAATTCVLAIRVTTQENGLKVMRNCVIGDVVEALEPILET